MEIGKSDHIIYLLHEQVFSLCSCPLELAEDLYCFVILITQTEARLLYVLLQWLLFEKLFNDL